MEANKTSRRFQFLNIGCVVLIAVIIILLVNYLFADIAETASKDYARYYSQDAGGKLNSYLNHEIELVEIIATSPSLIEWFSDENNIDKKARAVDEMLTFGSLLYSTELYFVIHNSLDEYSIDVAGGASIEDFEPFDIILPEIEYNQWYFRAISSENRYSLNIDIDKVTNQRRLWINYRVEKDGEPIGVFCSGLLFDDLFDNLFTQYDPKRVRTMIINEDGIVQMDSDPLLYESLMNEEIIHIRDVSSDSAFLSAIETHLGSQAGLFSAQDEPVILMLPTAGNMYVSIAPIENTNWTVVTFFNSELLFSTARLRPLMITVLIALIVYSVFIMLMNSRYIKSVETSQKSLQKALSDAETANQAKSQFLANMSHEIRTPLNAIMGITEIQLHNADIPDDFKDAFDKIHDSGDLLLCLINDILDLSKIEESKLDIVPVCYSVPNMIFETARLNHLRYESKPIEFVVSVDKDTPKELVGDELRIRQILGNLLSNAFKYTDAGEVKLSVRTETGTNDDVSLIFEVSDTGQGLTKEQITNLYEEYVRFNLEKNRTIAGTGLGLNITRRLINMMSGDISVDSEPGKGTVFAVRLPQERAGTEVCGAEVVDNLRHFRYKSESKTKSAQFIREYMPYGNVLIVDDVKSNLYVAKGLLMPYGLQIETATNGQDVIKRVKVGKVYDLILMDHMMPKMDGIEVTKHLRSIGYTAPVVALTANAFVGQAEMFISEGFDGYLSKPIDSRELNNLLNEFIRNRKSHENDAAGDSI